MTMPLLFLHKVLIAGAIGASVLLAASALWRWSRPGSPSQLGVVVLAVVVAVGLSAYLSFFIRRSRERAARALPRDGMK